MSEPVELSIVTTLYRSAATIEEFVRRSIAAAETVTQSFEIVIVDDASPDDSLAIAIRLCERDPRIRVVELSRNFGHHRALMTGLMHAEGRYSFLIDSDLEEAPELLAGFWNKLHEEGYDVVHGYQRHRQGAPVVRYGGWLAWQLIKRLYSIDIPYNQSTVRLMRADYVQALVRHQERSTVIGGLWVITGFRQLGLPIDRVSRDISSYSIANRLSALANGITSFSARPLVLMTYFGFCIAITAFIGGISAVIMWMFRDIEVGWTSLIVSVWMIGGIIITCLGIIGIYIARIFIETKNRPYVIVRKIHMGNRADEHRG